MTTFDEFRAQLRDALPHLNDPGFVCPALLAETLELPPDGGVDALRERVANAIARLTPSGTSPPNSRARRFHDILSYRYLQGLTQEQSAERLGIVVRHLARQQNLAVDALTRLLWERGIAAGQRPGGLEVDIDEGQVGREVSALTEHSPDQIVDLVDALHKARLLTHIIADRRGIVMQAAPIESSILANCHPSVLQQALVVTISYLLRHMVSGQIELAASGNGSTVRVTLRASPCLAPPPAAAWMGHKLVASQHGATAFEREADTLVVHLLLPSAQCLSVLVVDDNQDLVQFYRYCTAGTRYHISSMPQGTGIFERIEQLDPDVIVLDLMLPDIDGWELLTQLHEHPLSRKKPIVLCSVVQEEELALALGAHVVLSKPVRRLHFLRALDEAISRAGRGG